MKMKKIFSLLVLSCMLLVSHAQEDTYVYICKDGDYTKQKVSEGFDIDTVTPLPSSVSEGESNWNSAFSVGDLTDGKDRNYGYGSLHWVAIATA